MATVADAIVIEDDDEDVVVVAEDLSCHSVKVEKCDDVCQDILAPEEQQSKQLSDNGQRKKKKRELSTS